MGNDLYMILDALIAAAGLYVIIQYAVMVTSRKIPQNMLLPKNVEAHKCKDPEGYIKYIGPKQLVFGIAATLCGGFNVYQDLTGTVNGYISFAGTLIFLACTIWYAYAMRKSMPRFWGMK